MSLKISKKDIKTKTDKLNKPKRSNRKWSHQENVLILEYLLDSVQSGYEIEKPTAALFYQGLIAKTKIGTATPLLIKNKVRNHRSIYVKALEWKKKTGQGIIDSDGEVTFKDVLLKRYPYIDLYQQIWGGRKNVIPPSTSQVTQIGRPINDAGTKEQVQHQSLDKELPSIPQVTTEISDVDTEQVEQQDEILSTAVHPIDAQEDLMLLQENVELINDGDELIQDGDDDVELIQYGDELIQNDVELIQGDVELIQGDVELIQDGNRIVSLIGNCAEPG